MRCSRCFLRQVLIVALFAVSLLASHTVVFGQTDTTARLAKTGKKKVKKDNEPASVAPLFATDEPLSFTLVAQMQRIVRDRTKPAPNAVSTRHPARVRYTTPADSLVALPADAIVRGNFRRDAANCLFPPLYLNFPKKVVKGTLFAKQNKLKLVTHCRDDEYVVREYLVYKLYNLLTDLSFKARLTQVTYADSAGKRKPETHWGILLEDEDDMAKRNHVSVYKNKLKAAFADTLNMATLSVFEYMIGNTDWSVVYRHNIRMVVDSTRPRPLGIPYDFDHSGLVNARYAKPAEQLAIESVRDRLYRGPVYSMAVFNRVFTQFRQLKPQMYALFQTDKRLNSSYIKETTRFFDDFYRIIDNPEKARDAFQSDINRSVQIRGMND